MSVVDVEENWKDKYFKYLLDQEKLEEAQNAQLLKLYNELLLAFSHVRGQHNAIDSQLNALPTSPKPADIAVDQLHHINLQIADHLSADSPSEVTTTGSSLDSLTAAKQTLLKLIEISPDEITQNIHAEDILDQLESATQNEQLFDVVTRIKDVVQKVLDERSHQIKNLSKFLGGVSKRLEGMKQHVKENRADREAANHDRGDLSKLVGDNLQLIRESVAESQDVNELQNAIDTQLDHIDSSVSSYVEKETERADRAEKNTAELQTQLNKLEHESTQLRASLNAARTQAIIDPLTGVANRRAYDERMEIEYSRWKRKHEPMALAIMDIDHFKHINDTYGHPVGDKVLKVVAGRIQQQVRESDFFGRIGGEEFAFLLVDSDLGSALEKNELLRESISECNFRIKKKKFQVTMSMGIAQFRGNDTLESVYQRADDALTKAKQSGRNRCLTENDLK